LKDGVAHDQNGDCDSRPINHAGSQMPLSIGRRAGHAYLWITGAIGAAFFTAPRSRSLMVGNALEHPEDLRPHRDGCEKQAQRGQRDRFFQD
jgi:hypothetical protein